MKLRSSESSDYNQHKTQVNKKKKLAKLQIVSIIHITVEFY